MSPKDKVISIDPFQHGEEKFQVEAFFTPGNPSLKGDCWKPKSDPVNHPSHYKQYEGFEVIDITKQLPFLEGNAVKYILRAPFKKNEKEDIEKAIWYLKKKLEELNV